MDTAEQAPAYEWEKAVESKAVQERLGEAGVHNPALETERKASHESLEQAYARNRKLEAEGKEL